VSYSCRGTLERVGFMSIYSIKALIYKKGEIREVAASKISSFSVERVNDFVSTSYYIIHSKKRKFNLMFLDI